MNKKNYDNVAIKLKFEKAAQKRAEKRTKKVKASKNKLLDPYYLSGKDLESNKFYIATAKKFKKDLLKNRTQSEKTFDTFLKEENIHFEFQKIVYIHQNNKITKFYIADFYIPSANLIIEIDGGYHSQKEQMEKDYNRTVDLNKNGYKVLRFINEEISDKVSLKLKINRTLSK